MKFNIAINEEQRALLQKALSIASEVDNCDPDEWEEMLLLQQMLATDALKSVVINDFTA